MQYTDRLPESMYYMQYTDRTPESMHCMQYTDRTQESMHCMQYTDRTQESMHCMQYTDRTQESMHCMQYTDRTPESMHCMQYTPEQPLGLKWTGLGHISSPLILAWTAEPQLVCTMSAGGKSNSKPLHTSKICSSEASGNLPHPVPILRMKRIKKQMSFLCCGVRCAL